MLPFYLFKMKKPLIFKDFSEMDISYFLRAISTIGTGLIQLVVKNVL